MLFQILMSAAETRAELEQFVSTRLAATTVAVKKVTLEIPSLSALKSKKELAQILPAVDVAVSSNVLLASNASVVAAEINAMESSAGPVLGAAMGNAFVHLEQLATRMI